jgi:hypothetical protein
MISFQAAALFISSTNVLLSTNETKRNNKTKLQNNKTTSSQIISYKITENLLTLSSSYAYINQQ